MFTAQWTGRNTGITLKEEGGDEIVYFPFHNMSFNVSYFFGNSPYMFTSK